MAGSSRLSRSRHDTSHSGSVKVDVLFKYQNQRWNLISYQRLQRAFTKKEITMKSLTAFLSLFLIVPLSIAHAEESSTKHTEKTTADGTLVKTDTSHETAVSSDGSRNSVQDTKTVVDPKGLMNKDSVEKHSEQETSPNGDYSNSDTVRHADGSLEEVKSKQTTSNHWTDKGKDTTTTYSHTVDPKGLGNKASVEVTEKENVSPGKAGVASITTKVNGDTISREVKVTP